VRIIRPRDQATKQGSVRKGLKKDGRAAKGERDSYKRLKAAAGLCTHLP